MNLSASYLLYFISAFFRQPSSVILTSYRSMSQPMPITRFVRVNESFTLAEVSRS